MKRRDFLKFLGLSAAAVVLPLPKPARLYAGELGTWRNIRYIGTRRYERLPIGTAPIVEGVTPTPASLTVQWVDAKPYNSIIFVEGEFDGSKTLS